MSSGGKFAESLVAGQLTFASNMVVQKKHVVRLRRSAFDDDVDDLSKFLSKAKRTAKIAEIDSKRRGLWSAPGLCGIRGEQTTRKSTMPMLANVLLRTQGKNQLLVAATDLNVSLTADRRTA